jgi:hypothetical protein
MRTIKTYSKRAPFYNALIRHVNCFRVRCHSGMIDNATRRTTTPSDSVLLLDVGRWFKCSF